MATQRRAPGAVRDAILVAFRQERRAMTVAELHQHVSKTLGEDVPRSSVRSYLNINTPGRFIRSERGTYRLVRR